MARATALLASAALAAASHAQTLRVAACAGVDGPLGPALAAGERFFQFNLGPQIMDDGTVVFTADVLREVRQRTGVWARPASANVPVAVVGETAFGMPIVQPWNSLFDGVSVRGNAAVIGGGVDGTYRYGLWRWTPEGMALLVRHRDTVPGLPNRVVFAPYQAAVLDAAGTVWNDLDLQATSGVRVIFARMRPGDPLTVVQGSPAPAAGLPAGANVLGVSGTVAPDASILGSLAYNIGNDPMVVVLASRAGDQWTVRHELGSQAPGCPAGVVTGPAMRAWSLNGGSYAFLCRVAGPGVNSSNDLALFIDRGAGLTLALREGDPLPEFRDDATLMDFERSLDVTPDGRIAAVGIVSLRNPDGLQRWTLIIDDPGRGRWIALRQNNVTLPGLNGLFVRSIGPIATGPAGHVAVLAGIDGLNAGPDDQGVWVMDPGGQFRFVIKTRDPIRVPGVGTAQTTAYVFHESGDLTGTHRAFMPQAINTRGDLAFTARSSNMGPLVAVSPASALCDADFNEDGFIDCFDYIDYLSCFELGVCGHRDADYNADGFADFFDYSDFVAAFEAGC